VLVSFLVPVDKGITGLEYGVGRNDCFGSILAVVARLVVDGAVVKSQREESFLRAAGVEGKLGCLRRDRDRQWLDRFDVNEEFEQSCDADVGAAVHHGRRGHFVGTRRSTVDPSSNPSIGVFVSGETKNTRQADNTCDAVHGKHVCVEVVGQERGRVIVGQVKREFERSHRRCWTKEDAGVGQGTLWEVVDRVDFGWCTSLLQWNHVGDVV
jgi:hypothetical protein